MLPDEMTFCPHCATSQVEKTEVKIPRLWRRKTVAAVLVLVAAIAVFLGIKLYHQPKVYEGGADLVYEDKDGIYELLVTFDYNDGAKAIPVEARKVSMGDNSEGGMPAQLYIYQEGNEENGQAEFMEKVESYGIKAIPLNDGTPMSCSVPEPSEALVAAALVSDVAFKTECDTNVLQWTLNMKNGDTIILKQSIEVERIKAVSYYPDETPMGTIEELQALLDRIDEELDSETIAYIYLPPVTYEGELRMSDRTYMLYGGTDGENVTTFTDTIYIESKYPQEAQIQNVLFAGNEGVGIQTSKGVALWGCTFTGWKVGALALNGGWIGAQNCVFENNEVGIKFDSNECTYHDWTYSENQFLNNQVAVQLNQVPGNKTFTFQDTIFSGNGENIKNDAQHPVDMAGAEIE